MNRRIVETLALAAILLAPVGASADWVLNMREGVTPISHTVHGLHMLILWICVGIGVVVFGAIGWAVVNHRKSKGAVAADFHENAVVEAVWTIIPIIILVLVAIPSTKALIDMHVVGEPDLTVQATGYQWKWKYDYLDEGIGFFSVLDEASQKASELGSGIDPASVDHYLLNVDQPLVLPVKKRIRILTTSADVIHSWWVPDLGFKRDANPGFINESWTYIEEPGVYRGQCAELCGKGHGFMPIVVKAVSEEEFRDWVAQKKAEQQAAAAAAGRTYTKEELLAKGEEVYGRQCVACHQANGQGLPGVFKALAGSPVVTGPKSEHIATVLHGRPGTAMAAFGPQLGDLEIAAVITYERNAWGNADKVAAGEDVVQPAEVKAARAVAAQ